MRFAAIVILSVYLALPVQAQETLRSISVNGRGEVAVVPDMATVSLGVETSDTTAFRAIEVNSAVMEQVIAALSLKGIEALDVQTSALNLNPRWDRNSSNNEPRLVGYTVSNVVTVRVRELKNVGRVLDAVTQSGANRKNSITFGLQDNSEPLDQARVLAVKDAMRKAALYAEAAGVVVGNVVTIDDTGRIASQPLGAARLAMESVVPVEAGELLLVAQVRIVLQIE